MVCSGSDTTDWKLLSEKCRRCLVNLPERRDNWSDSKATYEQLTRIPAKERLLSERSHGVDPEVFDLNGEMESSPPAAEYPPSPRRIIHFFKGEVDLNEIARKLFSACGKKKKPIDGSVHRCKSNTLGM